MKYIFVPFLLSGCNLYGGMSVHDTAFDSEFKDSNWLGRYGLEQDFGYFRAYVQHQSMVNEQEKPGHGINEIGIDVKYKLF